MTIMVGTAEHDPIDEEAADGPGRWSGLASLGLVMAAAGPLLIIAAALAWGLDDTGDLSFFAVTGVAALAGAALMRQRRTWMKVIAVVLAVLVGMALFWTAFGISSPASFFDFVPAVLVLPGALIGFVAGIAAVRSGRRRPGDVAAQGERRAMQGVLAAVGALVVVSAILSIAGRETVSDADAASADLVVDLKDFEFDAEGYDVQGGATVLVKNSDPFLHTFTIDELGIDVSLNGGSEKLVTIPDLPGTYVLYCEPHTSDTEDPSEDDMAAEITVG